MKNYTTSEFAKKAHVTVRAVRYYDEQGLLKPSGYSEAGYRNYSDEDFIQLQKITSLKYLGFSLKEIQQLTASASSDETQDKQNLLELFDLQIRLMQKKIENLKQVESALTHARGLVEDKGRLAWEDVVHLICLMEMENQLVEQYRNAENVNVRIQLHARCSVNKKGWFPWLLEQAQLEGSRSILEIGCGNGELWKRADPWSLKGKRVVLSDISTGMVEDAKKTIKNWLTENACSEEQHKEVTVGLSFANFDCEEIPLESERFDRVLANHVLFYCKNVNKALKEICRVMKQDGMLCCSTYGSKHMQEISALVKRFDDRVNLSEIELHQIFGLENGEEILRQHFEQVELVRYEDELIVDDDELLCDYIFSCHGNQAEYLYARKQEFRDYVQREVAKKGAIHITKDAGVFLCRKPKHHVSEKENV